MPWLPLIAVTALALGINAWGLTVSGYGNTYYAAAVRSMTLSWHNFFFGAFDPGGFITVDKPPVFLWVDALSARIFGYNSLALLMPSAAAGAASVALLWLIMRRYFGVAAATIAALVLALTPISVAVNRLNLPEPFLLLALIGAAGCVLRSLEPGRWLWWTVGAGLLVGLAFNTKMLVGWVPGPALAIALVVGLRGAWWLAWQEWIPRVAVFGSVALIASVLWMLAVDAWPASERPYVGGSQDNTVYDLMLGYNGFSRVDGESGFGDGNRSSPGFGGRPAVTNTSAARPGSNPLGAGGIIAGEPGALRMFDEANGGQIAWFLPFAAIGGFVSLWRWRHQDVPRAAVVLWLGWAFLFAAVFSYAQGIYHSYYTAAMAPGIAALVGLSCVAVADLAQGDRRWLIAAFGMGALTLYVQLVVTGRFDGFFDWVTPLTVVLVFAGGVLLIAAVFSRRMPMLAGMTLVVGGLLLLPAAWSGYESAHASSNTTLPQAGPRNGGPSSRSFGSRPFDAGVPQLAAWLQDQARPGERWDLAVASAQNASTLIAEHGLSVMAIGGFSGADPTITAAEFGEYVANGDIRFVLVSGIRSGPFVGNVAAAPPGANGVMARVQAVCERVRDSSLPGQLHGNLFDCSGRATALGAR